jgi:diguanylate cyclase (GGDEF)-like protein/PAS domain S-box-containing protein
MTHSLFQSVVENASDAILVLSQEGSIVLSNPAAAGLFARRQTDLAGEFFGFPIAAGKATEINILRRNDSPAVAEMRVSEAFWQHERVFVAILRDVTERKQVESRLLRLQKLYSAIVEADKLISRTRNATELYSGICKIAVELGGLKMAWIGTRNEADQSIIPLARFGQGTDYLEKIFVSTREDIPEGQGPTGIAFREGHAVLSQDFLGGSITSPWRDQAKPYGWGSSATFPVQRGSKPFATITVYHSEKYAFDREMVDLLEGLGAAISRAVDAIELERERKEYRQKTSLHDAEQRRNAEQYRTIIQASFDGFWIVDASGRILDVNDSVCKMLGYEREELLGLSIGDIEVDESPEETAAHISEMMATGHVQFEARHRSKDGTIINVAVNVLHVADLGERLFVFIRDVTKSKQAELQLRIAATVFEAQEGMVVTDDGGVILRINQAFTDITGFAADEVLGHTPGVLKSGRHDAGFYRAMWKSLNQHSAWKGEIWNRRKNGEVYPEWLSITAVKDDCGAVTNYVGTFTDITLRKTAEDEIRHLAFYDPLTQLPNRRLMLDRLRHALTGSARHRRHGALMLIDLDNFKTLNDSLGHDVGDQLLVEVASRLEASIREGDTAARLGGDEFLVILVDLGGEQAAAMQAEGVARKILKNLSRPYRLQVASAGTERTERSHHCTSSIGVTLFRDQSVSVDELMKRADTAMYKAKGAGRNSVRLFDPEMQAVVEARANLESDLRAAISDGQLQLYFQAQVDSAGRLIGVESLVRWQHPERGLVLPADFIPMAEETGLILPLGFWVLETACAQLAAWSERTDTQHLTMAVNISARQASRPDFVRQVLSVLAHTHARPERLKLELTETLLFENSEDIIAKMLELKSKGVGFSLDDFGTGYSSLSYLNRLPLDQLKIDQSFVREVLNETNDAAIAETIVALGMTLGLSVVAEGVETAAQRDFLISKGCHLFQGYFFCRPMPLTEFEEFVKRT